MMLPSGLTTCIRTLTPWGRSKRTPRKSALPLIFRHFYIFTDFFTDIPQFFAVFLRSIELESSHRVKMPFRYVFFSPFSRCCMQDVQVHRHVFRHIYILQGDWEKQINSAKNARVRVNWPSDHPNGVTLTVRDEEQRLGSKPRRTLIVPL